ncbi:MAG: imelysin family protein, partial [Pseudomonadota bacterium]
MSTMKLLTRGAALTAFALLLAACEGDDGDPGPQGPAGPAGPAGADGAPGVVVSVTRDDVVKTNANIAYAAYGDSLLLAISLRGALEDLVADPTEENFAAAKAAWLASNEPYGQTEVYRFRVGPIDALLDDGSLGDEGDGPEGALNAWPLAESLIDYVANDVDGDALPELPASNAAINDNIIADTVNFPTIDG